MTRAEGRISYGHLGRTNSCFYCADPYCKTEGALHGHYIMCYSEQYVRLKRNVFSPRRKATDVDFVLFSSVSSWFHARGAAVENARSAIFPVRPWQDIVPATGVAQ